MINKVNSSQGFGGIASYYVSGKKVLSKMTTPEQDKLIKIFADAIAPKGYLLSNLSDDSARVFHKFLEQNIFRTNLEFGTQKKVMSNISAVNKAKQIEPYISYGDIHSERQGGINFNIIF